MLEALEAPRTNDSQPGLRYARRLDYARMLCDAAYMLHSRSMHCPQAKPKRKGDLEDPRFCTFNLPFFAGPLV